MSVSARADQEARERRAWIEEENRKEREKEDRKNYEAFTQALRQKNFRVAPANRVEVPTFEAVAPYVDESNNNAKRRWDEGLVAFYSAQNIALLREMADRPLEDFQPGVFDQIPRSKSADLADPEKVREACQDFYDTEIRFRKLNQAQRKQVVSLMAAFCDRNDLDPSHMSAWATAFSVLWETAQVPHPEPEPEPEVPVESIEAQQAREQRERDERRRAYRERIVVTDPRNGRGYTQYQLDNEVSADDYVRLLGLPRTDSRVNIPTRRA